MFKEKSKKLKLEVFENYPIEIVFTTDVKRTYENHQKRYKWTSNYEAVVAVHVSFGGKSTVILPWDASVDLIAHECFHIVWRLFDNVGAEFNNEIMAYMLGYFVKEAVALKSRKKCLTKSS